MDLNDNGDDVERLLSKARKALQGFEDGVDTKRVKLRLTTASPGHPVLIAKLLFLVLTLILVLLGLVTLSVPFIAPSDLARQFALIEAGIGLPIPAVMFLLAGCFAVAWLGAGQAALAIGRESPMLPWEQKEHQRLVNEVTRLSSQKAVMERIRGTPMGAKPRIATPVPVSLRRSTPAGASPRFSTPGASPRFSRPASGVLGGRSSPSYVTEDTPYASQAPAEHPDTGGGIGMPKPSLSGGGGGGFFGTPAPARSAGRARPVPTKGTPLGAAPRTSGRALGTPAPTTRRKPRLSAPIAYPGTPESSPERSHGFGGGSIFGTPAPSSRTKAPALSYATPEPDVPNIVDEATPSYAAEPVGGATNSDMPHWGKIDEPWLEDAIEKAEIMAAGFPIQAHLEFSIEEHLPFTLVIERATPAMAVRSMVAYIEFLASIATPARGRVELRSVSHLDRSFHRNVMAALEPYFPDTVEVERHPGRVEIIFHEPDAGWAEYPYLPIG